LIRLSTEDILDKETQRSFLEVWARNSAGDTVHKYLEKPEHSVQSCTPYIPEGRETFNGWW